jgi:hypothetical protein
MLTGADTPEILEEEGESMVGTPKLERRVTKSTDGRGCSIPDINNSGSSRQANHANNLFSTATGFGEITNDSPGLRKRKSSV